MINLKKNTTYSLRKLRKKICIDTHHLEVGGAGGKEGGGGEGLKRGKSNDETDSEIMVQ